MSGVTLRECWGDSALRDLANVVRGMCIESEF
jgi:hypothetical protein